MDKLLQQLSQLQEVCWRNEALQSTAQAAADCALTMADIEEAAARLERFAPYFRLVFPETQTAGGLVESPLRPIDTMQNVLQQTCGVDIPGRVWLKMDSHLPISGSIKSRGGVYEVLKFAEDTAFAHGLLRPDEDYSRLDEPELRALFSRFSIAVGSTGNLGLSIGIMSARLGFRVQVHMSSDARQWKKDLLRSKGVEVIEYEGDYSSAVTEGRKLAEQDPMCHFVDDENSRTLFLGYAVAALRLRDQLHSAGVTVDADHPLLVYLPCGVGGAPAGVAFGIKQVFGDAAHCFFAEPTHACCMLLGLATGQHSDIAVTDLGIDGRTAADGLAVSRPSGFAGRLIQPFLSGCYTLTDERMMGMLTQLADSEDIRLEPSALAGMYGPVLTASDPTFAPFRPTKNTTHIVWATGGSMVPPEIMEQYYQAGK